MEIVDKIVDFHKYCKTCEFKNFSEADQPCDECLSNPTNTYSQKPTCYKPNEKLVKQEAKKEEEEKEENK